jgi:hypothetical protein
MKRKKLSGSAILGETIKSVADIQMAKMASETQAYLIKFFLLLIDNFSILPRTSGMMKFTPIQCLYVSAVIIPLLRGRQYNVFTRPVQKLRFLFGV